MLRALANEIPYKESELENLVRKDLADSGKEFLPSHSAAISEVVEDLCIEFKRRSRNLHWFGVMR